MSSSQVLYKNYLSIINEAKKQTFYINTEYSHRKKRVARDVVATGKFPYNKQFDQIIILQGTSWKLYIKNQEKVKYGLTGPDTFDLKSTGSDLQSLHSASSLGYEAISKYL